MSYYTGGPYPQPHQPAPPESHHDPYRQHQQPAQNGGYAGQYAQQSQYPGQPTYNQYGSDGRGGGGGPVQQPQNSYHQSDYQQNPPYSGGLTSQQPQYDPQRYSTAAAQPAGAPQTYNPQAYATLNSTPYPQQQYHAAAYTQVPAHSLSGPVDPYAYSPGNYSNPTFSPQPPPQHQFASPALQQQTYSPQQHYTPPPPPPPNHQYSYQQSPPLSQHSGYGYQQPPGASNPQELSRVPNTFRPASNSISQRPYVAATPDLPSAPAWPGAPAHYQPQDTRQSPSPLYQAHSPPSTTSGPTPPVHGIPGRSPTFDRHPQSRPLPAHPAAEGPTDYFYGTSAPRTHDRLGRDNTLGLSSDALFDEIENNILAPGRSTHSPSISVTHAPFGASTYQNSPSFSPQRGSLQSANGATDPHLSPARLQPHDPQYGSDSDAEAAQGLAMLRMAEEDDARRQSSGGQQRFSVGHASQASSAPQHADGSDSDDYAGFDMTTFGGGYDVHMTYGGDPVQLAAGGEVNGDARNQAISSQRSSVARSRASLSSRGESDHRTALPQSLPPFNTAARVDEGGTGGLSEPTGLRRRQSYDEGDEDALTEGQLPDRFPDEPPDIDFQPARTSYRPLPPPPPSQPHSGSSTPRSAEFKALPPLPDQNQSLYPLAPDMYNVNEKDQWVPRSTSLVSHSSTPTVAQPLRSKTDAEERRSRLSGIRTSVYSTVDPTPPSASMMVDLPAIGKRFAPSKLGAPDFKKCDEPWSLASLQKWLLQVTNPEQNTELREAEIKEALVALFTNKVPTMNIADAEGLSNRVVTDMYDAGTLVKTEEWVKLVPGVISGVIFQLTMSGCYAPKVHDHLIPNMRCYSHHCQKTLKKVNLQAQPVRSAESWAEYYYLKKEDLEGKDKKELERQNVLHEIVSTEEGYMLSLDVLRSLYRDPLNSVEPSIITPKRKEKFIHDVFGRVDLVKQANEEHLLPQLKYRQQEQGPWIVGFSDIFRQWIRKAKSAYVDYANDFPRADYLVRQEMDRNIEFRNYAERARNDKRSNRLPLDSFLKSPISRLQRYALLLNTVMKTMQQDSEEKANLKLAIDEVRAVALECDGRVADMQRKIDLADLGNKLVLRPGMQNHVELNLDHYGRELIHRGDLQRMGTNKFTWLDCHALLFDHYLILAKTVSQRAEQGGKVDRYDVSRMPIPMDLLILESAYDAPVQKSSYVKGITSVTTVTGRTSTPADPVTIGRTPSNQSAAPSLQHMNTGGSGASMQLVTTLGDGKEDRILYPFKVKHLGRDVYTLFAPSEQSRREWCNQIIEAKTQHAAALYAQNAEPFRLRVMADSAFVYDAFAGTGRGVVVNGSPIDRAIQEVEQRFKDTGRPGPVCRARVNCATSFTTPYPCKQMVAVGTEYGVFVSELDNPRGWQRVITMSRVTQVAVLEEFNLFLLISDKSLIAYHLDVVCLNERNGPVSTNDSSRKAPQKLSGNKDVGFFVCGRMKDRTLVFYKRRENLNNSVFKVLEPIYQKSTEKKRGIFKRGTTEFFREYDEFYIPAESSGINLFHSSLAVSTARGFEVLTLDKKQPFSVPELRAEHVQNIASTIKDQGALSMLRLSDQEFLLVYAHCAVYVNKHGDVSRSVIMEFVGNALNAALFGPYLVLFNEDFVEIRNAQNGRLKQIIAGREIKCLDDGSNWPVAPSAATPAGTTMPVGATTAVSANGTSNGAVPQAAPRTLKFVMQHPALEKTQLVVELLMNENRKE